MKRQAAMEATAIAFCVASLVAAAFAVGPYVAALLPFTLSAGGWFGVAMASLVVLVIGLKLQRTAAARRTASSKRIEADLAYESLGQAYEVLGHSASRPTHHLNIRAAAKYLGIAYESLVKRLAVRGGVVFIVWHGQILFPEASLAAYKSHTVDPQMKEKRNPTPTRDPN